MILFSTRTVYWTGRSAIDAFTFVSIRKLGSPAPLAGQTNQRAKPAKDW